MSLEAVQKSAKKIENKQGLATAEKKTVLHLTGQLQTLHKKS